MTWIKAPNRESSRAPRKLLKVMIRRDVKSKLEKLNIRAIVREEAREAARPRVLILPDKPGLLLFKVRILMGSFLDKMPISEAIVSDKASAIREAYTTGKKEFLVK